MVNQLICCLLSAVILRLGHGDGREDMSRFSKTELKGGESSGGVYGVHDVESNFGEGLD